MGMMNIDDEQLLRYLLKFLTGMLVDCDQIRFVDLYGKEKPSQLFATTDRHHVFTQLKKKKGNGKNFNRGIVGGGGSWKGVDNGKPVYNKKGLKIGFKKTFRFDEENHVWIMKEYRPSDNILKALRLRGQIRHEEEFAVCSITRSVNSSKEQSSTTNVVPSDESNSGNVGPVTLVIKESNVSAAKEDECSVYDIATYHKELDAYAAFQLKSMVPNIPQQQEDDEPNSIPLFYEDFTIDYTHLLT
ncbi:hypothetical protein EJD97_003276 [Solanum chilense]|uniref:NAC domain-containing protein n=1 Tax=Solanum chilense TaxID=4083 RepID=A0A6N2BWE9_SOLCI|nr:hypothetical protein EJD97_003276 [Solanum chilense]